MSERPYGIGADDPAMGRDVVEAYERDAAEDASPGATWIGTAAANVVGCIALMVGVCVVLGLVWVAVRIAEAL